VKPSRVTSAGLLIAFIAVLTMPAATHAATSLYDRQLVRNGAAESDTGTMDPQKSLPATGWQRVPPYAPVLVLRYGAKGVFPQPDSPGAPYGRNFLWGGYAARASGLQDIDLSAAAADIDERIVHFKLSAWLGGRQNMADHCTVSVAFLDSGARNLGGAYVGPVTNTDRGGVTSFLYREISQLVPAGARTARITLLMVRYEGDSNDGYVDDVSFILHKSTAPAH
jgi:hypothetical protein